MVSALCPNCSILLVEADSSSLSNLDRAVREAAKLDATTISIGFGGSEFKSEDANSPYDAGRPVTVASGDSGYGPGYPAALPYVIAVGATKLTKGGGGGRGWTETASGGGGCASYAAKPKWQKDDFCKTRTDNDVAFVGDPSTGVAMYDSYGYGGWMVVGGTSVGAPAIAAIYALAGNTHGIKNAKGLYQHAAELYDIPPAGYDEATGNGTPNATAAF
jgi:subtilase family serine protease